MTKILFTSCRGSHPRRAGFVEAATLAEAQHKLTIGGHREIRFHSDPNVGDAVGSDPEHALRLAEGPHTQGLWAFARNVALGAIGIGIGAWHLATEQSGWAMFFFAISIIGAVGPVPLLLYDRVRIAMSRGQYERAMAYLRPLMLLVWLLPKGARLRAMLTGDEARILAGERKLDRALEVLGRLRPKYEDIYDRQLASLYHRARDFETARRLEEERVALEPDASDARVQLALTLALRFGELDAARAELERASSLPAIELVRGGAALVESIVLSKKDPRAALARADEARRVFAKVPEPLRRDWMALIGAFRARALAYIGDTEAAARELAAVSPILLEDEEHELVDQSWEIVLAMAEQVDADQHVGPYA